jgi:CheY-like chemotaxis protein
MNNLHILLVEDEVDGQELVADMLGQFNISADVVGLAEEALNFLEQANYSAMIIDLALPGMDGMELLKLVKNNPGTAHLPCMAITAFHSSLVKQKAIEFGFDAYVPKPLNEYVLIHELERIVS